MLAGPGVDSCLAGHLVQMEKGLPGALLHSQASQLLQCRLQLQQSGGRPLPSFFSLLFSSTMLRAASYAGCLLSIPNLVLFSGVLHHPGLRIMCIMDS